MTNISMNECATGIIGLIGFTHALVKINPSYNLYSCLTQSAGHTTSATKEVYSPHKLNFDRFNKPQRSNFLL